VTLQDIVRCFEMLPLSLASRARWAGGCPWHSVPLSDVWRVEVGTWTCIERKVCRKLMLEKGLWSVALARNGTVDHIVNTLQFVGRINNVRVVEWRPLSSRSRFKRL
jgi:hypothetical protein